MFKRIEYLLDTLGAIAVVVLCLVIVCIVVWREFLGIGFPDGIIMVRELMVPAILFPLSATTAKRAHVSIDVLADHFPVALNRWIAALAAALGLFVVLMLIWAGVEQFARAWTGGSHHGGDFKIPKWPSRLVYIVAFAFVALRLAQILWLDLRAALTGTDAPAHL